MFQLIEDSSTGKYQHKNFPKDNKGEHIWRAPPKGMFRLDVDTSFNILKHAACEGVIRDDKGRWVMGFQRNLGSYLISIAKILAINIGLEVCRIIGLTELKVYSNSWEAIHILLRDIGVDHPFKQVIVDTRNKIFDYWHVENYHANRDSLQCANNLAKTAHVDGVQLNLLQWAPERCRE